MEFNESISKLEMPNLNDLELSLRSKRQLGKLLGVHGLPSHRGKLLADWYVRLTEKAIIEYEEARQKLYKFLQEGFADDYFRSQDHFETCINSLHRAIEYLERIRGLGLKSPDGKPFIPKPRELEILSEKTRSQIRNFRDACEHIDKDIVKPSFPLDQEIGIHLGWDKAIILDHKIQYKDLAKWIKQTHNFALLLSQVKIIVAP